MNAKPLLRLLCTIGGEIAHEGLAYRPPHLKKPELRKVSNPYETILTSHLGFQENHWLPEVFLKNDCL